MKKLVAVLLVVVIVGMFAVCHAEYERERLSELTDAEKSSLKAQISIALITRRAGISSSCYSEILGADLGELSLDELEEIQDYLDSLSNQEDAEKSLTNIGDFLVNFNLCASIMETKHTLSVDNAEISKLSRFVLFKTVFNNCEILSLHLNNDRSEVMSVQCTYSLFTSGATAYSDDFIYLLMETMYASGIGADLIIEALSETGFLEHYDVGDTGETIVNNIKISYEVTSVFGASFTIEPTD